MVLLIVFDDTFLNTGIKQEGNSNISIAYLALLSQKVPMPWDIIMAHIPGVTPAPPPPVDRRKDRQGENVKLVVCVIRMREVISLFIYFCRAQ